MHIDKQFYLCIIAKSSQTWRTKEGRVQLNHPTISCLYIPHDSFLHPAILLALGSCLVTTPTTRRRCLEIVVSCLGMQPAPVGVDWSEVSSLHLQYTQWNQISAIFLEYPAHTPPFLSFLPSLPSLCPGNNAEKHLPNFLPPQYSSRHKASKTPLLFVPI